MMSSEDWQSSENVTPLKSKRAASVRDDADDADDSSSGGLQVGSPFDPSKEIAALSERRAVNVAAVPIAASRTPAKAAVSGKKESAVSESKKKDESKKKAKKSSTATTAPAKATPGTSSTQAGATVSATATAPAAVSATATAAAAAAPISSSGKASTPSRGGYKKKLIRLFSNASDMSSQPDAAEQQKSQFEHEKALLVMQHKAQVESFERQLRELTDKVDSLKSENAQLVDERDAVAGERDKWEQRCLNQKKKIEALELDAEKFVKMMSQHHYVPGKTVHNVREPSFCPQF